MLVSDEAKRSLVEVSGVNVIEDRLRTEPRRVGVHAGHQVRALQSLDVARPVVDVGGGRHLTAHLESGDHDRVQVRTGRIESRRATGRTRAEDEEAAVPRDGLRHVARLD